MDNDSFDPHPGEEVAMILESIANALNAGKDLTGFGNFHIPLKDSKGEKVGYATVFPTY
jgi:nucleoid DNA-binding protein